MGLTSQSKQITYVAKSALQIACPPQTEGNKKEYNQNQAINQI